MERLGECENEGERKEWKRKENKRKEKERKEKRKGCWGREVVSGGSRGVAAAVECTHTDERTVCKDTYLHYVGVVVMGGWMCISAVTMISTCATVSFRYSCCKDYRQVLLVYSFCAVHLSSARGHGGFYRTFFKRIRFSNFSQQQHCYSNQNCDDDDAAHVVFRIPSVAIQGSMFKRLYTILKCQIFMSHQWSSG